MGGGGEDRDEFSDCEDSDASDGERDVFDSSKGWGPDILEDHEYGILYDDMVSTQAREAGIRAHRKASKQIQKDAKYSLKTDMESCNEVTTFRCVDCFVDCAFRYSATAGLAQNERRANVQYDVSTGSRLAFLSNTLQRTKTETPIRLHPEEHRKRANGALCSQSQIHYIVNGWDVCQAYFAQFIGETESLVHRASAQARSNEVGVVNDCKRRKTVDALENYEIFESIGSRADSFCVIRWSRHSFRCGTKGRVLA
jgi:hypothetical protein